MVPLLSFFIHQLQCQLQVIGLSGIEFLSLVHALGPLDGSVRNPACQLSPWVLPFSDFRIPPSKFFFPDFRIPTSEFFYMLYALFARNVQLTTRKS
jgi:hypothetical protein